MAEILITRKVEPLVQTRTEEHPVDMDLIHMAAAR